jgi:hypothetical protein
MTQRLVAVSCELPGRVSPSIAPVYPPKTHVWARQSVTSADRRLKLFSQVNANLRQRMTRARS